MASSSCGPVMSRGTFALSLFADCERKNHEQPLPDLDHHRQAGIGQI
jgi:hypothetical protein